MSLTRTPSGLAAEYLLYKETVVYVEGQTDIPFYAAVLQNYNCRIKAKHGKVKCEQLATALIQGNHPYVVILDGDYEILECTRSKHRRVILLHRHSFENYLLEEEAIERFCQDRAHLEDSLEAMANRFSEVVEDTELKFKELVVLDVAHYRSKTCGEVLPEKPDRFFNKKNTQKAQKVVDFQNNEIQKQYTKAINCIDKQDIEEARILVDEFLKEHRFIDLLPGHFAFGIIGRLISNTVNRNIKPEDIKVPLSREIWNLVKTPDHNSLKRRLRYAVREAEKMPRPGKGRQTK